MYFNHVLGLDCSSRVFFLIFCSPATLPHHLQLSQTRANFCFQSLLTKLSLLMGTTCLLFKAAAVSSALWQDGGGSFTSAASDWQWADELPASITQTTSPGICCIVTQSLERTQRLYRGQLVGLKNTFLPIRRRIKNVIEGWSVGEKYLDILF